MIAFAAFGAALFAAPARGGVVTRPEHVRATARGLSAAERRAITVASLSVAGDDSLGALVGVTFRGNVRVDSSTLTCAHLTALGNQLRQVRSYRIAPEIDRVVKARAVACAVPPAQAPPPSATTTTATTPPAPPPTPAVNVVQTDPALSSRWRSNPR